MPRKVLQHVSENQAYIDKLNCKQQLVASGVEEAQGNRGCDLGAAEVLK